MSNAATQTASSLSRTKATCGGLEPNSCQYSWRYLGVWKKLPSGSASRREAHSRLRKAAGSAVQSTAIPRMVAAASLSKTSCFLPLGGFIEACEPRRGRSEREEPQV